MLYSSSCSSGSYFRGGVFSVAASAGFSHSVHWLPVAVLEVFCSLHSVLYFG